MCEDGDGFAGWFACLFVYLFEGNVEDVRWGEVEVRSVPGQLGGEVGDAETEVAQLEDMSVYEKGR